MTEPTLQAFTPQEFELARRLLAAKISTMRGRKMEEGDWDFVYRNTKQIPFKAWSNLRIDVNHRGLGVEHKMLRIASSGSILDECGTTKMHPAGTRSIRIPNIEDANAAAEDVLGQYCAIIDDRAKEVREHAGVETADIRTGWLLWKDGLDEFLYFEVRMTRPVARDYYAKWNITPARGARKGSRSLWIYERATGQKRYSVTTEAGAKIQPYFDVPPPTDPNLYHFRVQGVMLEGGLVEVWLNKSTAKCLELLYGSLDVATLSDAVLAFDPRSSVAVAQNEDIAVPVQLSVAAYKKLTELFPGTSDEELVQQFALTSREVIRL